MGLCREKHCSSQGLLSGDIHDIGVRGDIGDKGDIHCAKLDL